MKKKVFAVIIILIVVHVPCSGQATESAKNPAPVGFTARFEHFAINVPDPQAAIQWYTKNLGMKLVRAGSAPAYSSFVADSGMNLMFEIQFQEKYPLLNPAALHQMALHFAFVTPDIAKTQKELLAAGATIVDSLRTTASGDQVITLRDPWGFAIQFVQRITPMLSHTGLFAEHIALNVADSREKARWYTENLGFVVIRDGKAPTYGMFIADAGKNLMYELYQNTQYPVIDFTAVSHVSMHIAFMVDDIQKAKDALIKAGATLVEDISKTPMGDSVLMLRDPWGLPIQCVKRLNPMVK